MLGVQRGFPHLLFFFFCCTTSALPHLPAMVSEGACSLNGLTASGRFGSLESLSAARRWFIRW